MGGAFGNRVPLSILCLTPPSGPLSPISSEVFKALLLGGMREAADKRVVIEDVDLVTFQALLKFLYSDDLSHVEEWTKSAIAESEGDAPPQRKRVAVLQRMLAAGHKYQLARLRLWCEQQLCECIDVDGACDVLRQAHLYEAKQLEAACLNFVKANMAAVAVTPGFINLSEECPAVQLKINLHIAGVPEDRATKAVSEAQSSRKRQRDEDGASAADGA